MLAHLNHAMKIVHKSEMDTVPNQDYFYVVIFAQKSHNMLTELLNYFLFYSFTHNLKLPKNMTEFLLNK